jgi:hypothetical protein
MLEGTRTLSAERARLIREARGEEFVVQRRVLEVEGFRVSWDEEDPEFAVRLTSSVRLGEVESARRFEERTLLLTLWNGQVAEMQVPGPDGGPGYEQIRVQDEEGAVAQIPWGAVESVTFSRDAAPAPPGEGRLVGTVEDRWGQRFSGAVTWDRTVALASDSLSGSDGASLRLAEVRELRRTEEGTTSVRTADGETRTLPGTGSTGRQHRGVEVMDPGLGRVRIPWRDVRLVSVEDATDLPSADPTAPGRLGRITGTARTRSGAAHTGTIIWDGDEAFRWEFLDGTWRGLEWSVVFAQIASVRRESSRAAIVTLRDGRVLEMRGSNDVSDENRGILVTAGDPEDPDSEWILIEWDDLEEVRFHEIP